LSQGVPAGDVLVLGLSRLDMITVNAWLNSKNIAAWLPAETGNREGLRVSTIHGAKGLDAGSVLLLDAHQLDSRPDAEARRLLYIAATRARRDLCVSHFRDSPLVAELASACAAG
jgi:superfamily I DNA/RNA helicase